MAASRNFNDEVEKLVECSICLGPLDNPRFLKCTHSYCKPCLDNILEFQPDGSAVITCPLRCNERTEIGVDETTNDLKASVQFRNIIDFLGKKFDTDEHKEQSYKCQEHPKCDRIVSGYCDVCRTRFCDPCTINHKHADNRGSEYGLIPVKYRTAEHKELLPWCAQHSTFATYACQEGYICIYCKARGHASHRYDKVEVLSQQIIAWVQNQKPELPDLENILQSSKEKAEEEVKRIRDKVASEIKKRTYQYMIKDLKKLREEEENLLSKYDSIVSKHLASYPSNKPADYIENKPKFEVFSDRENIFQSVRNITSMDVAIPELSFTFSEESMDETHPLGMLVEHIGTRKMKNEESTVSSSVSEIDVTNEVLRKLVEDLKLIEEEVRGINKGEGRKMNVTHANDHAKVGDNKIVEALGVFENKEDDDSKRKYLKGLMQDKDIASFKLLFNAIPKELLSLSADSITILHNAALMNRPTFIRIMLDAGAEIDCKAKNGGTALHVAALRGNIEVIQMLLQHNADILLKTCDGVNAIDCAKQGNNPGVVEVLSKELKKKNRKDDGKYSRMTIGQMKEQKLLFF